MPAELVRCIGNWLLELLEVLASLLLLDGEHQSSIVLRSELSLLRPHLHGSKHLGMLGSKTKDVEGKARCSRSHFLLPVVRRSVL